MVPNNPADPVLIHIGTKLQMTIFCNKKNIYIAPAISAPLRFVHKNVFALRGSFVFDQVVRKNINPQLKKRNRERRETKVSLVYSRRARKHLSRFVHLSFCLVLQSVQPAGCHI